jgi:hypothetical protein
MGRWIVLAEGLDEFLKKCEWVDIRKHISVFLIFPQESIWIFLITELFILTEQKDSATLYWPIGWAINWTAPDATNFRPQSAITPSLI